MINVERIYIENIKPLPIEEQRRLAELIIRRTAARNGKKRSALTILEKTRSTEPSRTADEINAYLKAERDSWNT